MAKILVIGKHPAERDGLALVMEFAGHRCATAGSFPEAKDLFRQEAYDLVLADSPLGENSSEQIVRHLKSVSPGVAVLVLTEDADRGYADDEASRREGRRSGYSMCSPNTKSGQPVWGNSGPVTQ